MKNFLISVLLLIGGCCSDSSAQCSKDYTDCLNHKTMGTKQKDMIKTASKPLTCKLTSPELRKRKEEIISNLKTKILEKKELPDGYAYKFNGNDEILDFLTAFIKSERMCCDFFNFKLLISNASVVWLEISGAEGAKEFIKTELEM
jgi:hypothetical protein